MNNSNTCSSNCPNIVSIGYFCGAIALLKSLQGLFESNEISEKGQHLTFNTPSRLINTLLPVKVLTLADQTKFFTV